VLNRAANTQNKSVRNLSIILYAIGFVAGLWLAGVTIWANMEASLFDAAMQSDETLDTLRCPALLSVTETGLVRATFHNGSERPLNFFVRANISNGYVTLMRQNNARLPLAPGESQELTWAVEAADAAYGRFVLVRVNVLRNPAYPTRDASCGIYLLPLPWLTGRAGGGAGFGNELVGHGRRSGAAVVAGTAVHRPLTRCYFCCHLAGCWGGGDDGGRIAALLDYWRGTRCAFVDHGRRLAGAVRGKTLGRVSEWSIVNGQLPIANR
jgi:hypothetical protein